MKIEDWDDLRFLLTLSREETLTRAAERLRVDQTTVSRRLKALQDRTDRVLFERLRGGVIFTAAGEAMVKAAEQMEASVLDLERRSAGREMALAGPLRLTIPELVAYFWMDKLWAFARKHPQIIFEIRASDSFKSLTRREADVALRFVEKPAEHLVGRKVGQMAIGIYAAPHWLDVPLDEVPWVGWSPLGYEGTTIERFRRMAGGRSPYVLWADAYMLNLQAAKVGVGATAIPCIIGDSEPDLVRLGPSEPVLNSIWLLTHEDLRRSPRVRALMAHITEFIEAEREALLGVLD